MKHKHLMILVEENPDMWECRCGFRKDLGIKRFRDIYDSPLIE